MSAVATPSPEPKLNFNTEFLDLLMSLHRELELGAHQRLCGGRTYLQIVESRRDGSSIRQHVVATLGRTEDWLDGGKLNQLLPQKRSFLRHLPDTVEQAPYVR